ncbi:MAG: helix-turn-helix domain-containing protein [Cyanobacteriota bacterium]|nr:helix-turn-helix domain-containing protein [Cyanobacteriota bacterium]
MQSAVESLGLNLVPLQLEWGHFKGQVQTLEIAPLRLIRFQVGGRVHGIGEKPRGVLAVSIDLNPRCETAPWLSHGQPLPLDCLFGQCIDRDIHITLPAHVSLGMVVFPLGALRQWADDLGWPGFAGELLPINNVHPLHPPTANTLRRYIRRVFTLAERDPQRLRLPASQRLVREDLIPLLLEALITGPGPSQGTNRPPARIEIVKDVQRWLLDHCMEPVTLADLCREAHASRRTLIQGFQDHLGMGPMAYVKLLRLHGIRRRLLQAEPGEIRIGALAELWGFHNPGHFAADFRRVFGESPGETLRRSPRDGLPATG